MVHVLTRVSPELGHRGEYYSPNTAGSPVLWHLFVHSRNTQLPMYPRQMLRKADFRNTWETCASDQSTVPICGTPPYQPLIGSYALQQ